MAKKPGAPKIVSWEDGFDDIYNERLKWGLSLETLEEECEWLAKWYRSQKISAPGTKHGISASRLQEKLRIRKIGAQVYKADRRKSAEKLLGAARAFLKTYYEYEQDNPDRLTLAGKAFLYAHDQNFEN